MTATIAPFETFIEYRERLDTDAPYDEAFILKCRKKAIEYSKEDRFLRDPLLSGIHDAVPRHFRNRVLSDDIHFNYVS